MKIDYSPEILIEQLAKINAKIIKSPFTETGYAIRRSIIQEFDSQLLNEKTRDMVIKKLLNAYGDIETINRLIKKKVMNFKTI